MVYFDKESGIVCISDKLTEEDAKKAIPFLRLFREFVSKKGIELNYFDLDEIENAMEQLQTDEVFNDDISHYQAIKIIPYEFLRRLLDGKTIEEIATELNDSLSPKKVNKILNQKTDKALERLWSTYKFPIINDIQITEKGEFIVRNIPIQEISGLERLFFDATRSSKTITIQELKKWLELLGETQNDSVKKMREIVKRYDDALSKKKNKLIAIGLTEQIEEIQQTEDISDIELFEGESLLLSIDTLGLSTDVTYTLKAYGIQTIQDFIGKTEIELKNFRSIKKDVIESVLSKLEKRGIVLIQDDQNGTKKLQYFKRNSDSDQIAALRKIARTTTPNEIPIGLISNVPTKNG